MRLLFVSNLFPDRTAPYFGLDNATVLHWLRERHGWEVRVISPRPTLSPARFLKRDGGWQPRDADAPLEPRFVASPYVPKFGGVANHALMAAALRRRIRELHARFRFDVLLASWLFPDGCAAARLAQEIGVPCVLITQGSDTHQYLAMPRRRRHILQAIGQSAAVITRSADLGRRLASAGAEPTKLHTIYNGVDTAVFRRRDQAEARRALGLPADARIFLFVGNFLPVKNPRLLVRAFAKYREARGDRSSLLVMAGKGPLQDEVRALAASLGLRDHVRLTGPLDSEQIARHMAAADLLCLSSRNEGLPNVILEALACGLPVLSTDVGGISEIVTPEHGRLVPEGDEETYAAALIESTTFIKHPALTDAPARFGWEAAAAAYARLIEQVRGEGHNRAAAAGASADE